MSHEDDQREAERRINEIIEQVKIARLGQPYALLAPKPAHFPRFSKCDRLVQSVGMNSTDPQIELIYSWGMPRDLPQTFVTYPGIAYGNEFVDFTIELFGLKGEDIQPDEIERLRQRQVGQVQYANATSESLPMKSGLRFTATDKETGDHISVWAWRWRVFMDNSSLCLENLWQSQAGWIPYVLGIKYDNPEKMVADAHRFAPAFKLCNMVEADLSEKRGGYLKKDIEAWAAQAIETMALASQKDGKIIPYSITRFSNAFLLSTSRQNIYNLLTQQEREGLESRYLKRCNELMTRPAD